MPTRVLEPNEITGILRTSVARLRELTTDLTDEQLHASPDPGEWSINDVLAHLRACNDVLGDAMKQIVAEADLRLKAVSPRAWQQKSGYHDWRFRAALDAFADRREALLEVLEPLPLDAWQRTAIVSVPPGKSYERSVQYYGDWLAAHERAHLRRMGRELRSAR